MKALAAKQRDVVVLFDAVATDAQPSNQAAVAIERHAAGEPHDSTLIEIRAIAAAARARTFRARIDGVIDEQIEERSRFRRFAVQLFVEIHTRRKQRLSAEAQGPRRDRPSLSGRRL